MKHITGIVLTTTEADLLVTATLQAQALAAHHGARLNPDVLALVSQIRSAPGTTEPTDQPTPDTEYEQVSSATAAKILGCTPRYVTQLASRGRLPGVKNAGVWWFNRDDVETYRDWH